MISSMNAASYEKWNLGRLFEHWVDMLWHPDGDVHRVEESGNDTEQQPRLG